MRVEGLTAVVTGGASGIGAATIERLLGEGARAVAALDLTEPPFDDSRVVRLVADVADDDSMRRAAAEVDRNLGTVDILVCNAGIGAVGTVEDNADEEWRRVFDVNVFGVVRTVRAFLPLLRKSATPSIVTLGSIVSTTGLPARACYGASKGAVLALSRAMAADYASEGIRVNCVCPGTVDTPWVNRLLDAASDPDASRRALIARQPIGRLGTAEEIADAIVYLAGPAAGYVTGSALAIDGGIDGVRVPTE